MGVLHFCALIYLKKKDLYICNVITRQPRIKRVVT